MRDTPCLGSGLSSCPVEPRKPSRKKSTASGNFCLPVLLYLVVFLITAPAEILVAAAHKETTESDSSSLPNFLGSDEALTNVLSADQVSEESWDVETNNDVPGSVENAAKSSRKDDTDVRELQGEPNSNGTDSEADTFFTIDDIDDEFCAEHCEEGVSSGWVSALPNVIQYLLIILLIAFSGLFSGLTLGLMGLDKTGLEIVMEGDDPVSAAAAKKIFPVRENGNLLLCTLLLGNVAVNALLSILLADKAGGLMGFLVSTGLIVIFGEIVPQAACSRYALVIGSRTVPLVRLIILLIYPAAAPLAFVLDKALGNELATTYSSAEMMKLLQIHVNEQVLDKETAVAMTGALKYKDMTVSEVMTPLKHTFMLNVDEKLNFETIATIFKTGYSRIPIYEVSKNNIIGLLFVKDLIFIDPEDETPVRNFVQIFGRGVHIVWPLDKLGDVLRELKQGRSHMAVVRDVVSDGETDPYYEIKGIITLEDIIEEILGHEIVDETDAFVDGSHAVKVDRAEGFEMAKLQLLGSKIGQERLSYTETRAITAHLLANYPKAVDLLTENQVERLVANTPVTVLPTASRELGKEFPDELMYEKDVPSDVCTLILSGKVTIITGADNFRTDISSWTLLAGAALRDPEYKPDFTAFVCHGPCRCLQFTRENFAYALDASASERHAVQEDQFRKLALEKTASNKGMGKKQSSALSQSGVSEGTSEYSERETSHERSLRMDDRRNKLIAALQISKENGTESSVADTETQHQGNPRNVGFGEGPHDHSSSMNTSVNEALSLGLHYSKHDSMNGSTKFGGHSESHGATQSQSSSSRIAFIDGHSVTGGSINSSDTPLKDPPDAQKDE